MKLTCPERSSWAAVESCGTHAEHHLGEVRAGPAAPVPAELLEDDLKLLALVPGLGGVRAGARVMAGVQPVVELLAGLAARARLRVVDVGGVVGRGLQGQRRRVAQVEDQRVGVGRVDRLDRAPDVGGAAVELDGALDRGLGRLRRQRAAGVEEHAVPEVEGPGLAAVRRRPAGGEQRPDGMGGAVVTGERLVHLAHRDDAVGVLGGRVPAVHHHRGRGVVGEHLVDRRRRAGRAGWTRHSGQGQDRHGGRDGYDEPSGWGFMDASDVLCQLSRFWVSLKMVSGHAAQRARRLDPDPDGGRGEVGQRYLFHLDDLHRVRVRARRDGPLAGLVPRLVQDRPAGRRRRGGRSGLPGR